MIADEKIGAAKAETEVIETADTGGEGADSAETEERVRAGSGGCLKVCCEGGLGGKSPERDGAGGGRSLTRGLGGGEHLDATALSIGSLL